MNLLPGRRPSCMRHCQSAARRTFCLARCLVTATTPPRRPVAVAVGSPWPAADAFLSPPSDCRANPGDHSGLRCDNMGRPMTDAHGMHPSQAMGVVDEWPMSPQDSVIEGHQAYKRGYNDVVDLCIAYNCPHVMPGSLDFMRCIRQFRCM